MKVRFFVGLVLLALIASCRDKEEVPSGDKLSGAALDAVDLVIVMQTKASALNPVSLSSNVQQCISKYEEGTTFEISNTQGLLSKIAENGTKIVILGELLCKYEGVLTYSVKLTGGEVGILDGEVYVQDGTRVQVDMDSYMFGNGKWSQIE